MQIFRILSILALLVVSSCRPSTQESEKQVSSSNISLDEIVVAAKANDADLLKKFAKKGADFNQANEKGETPLHLATQAGAFSAVEALHRGGANLDTQDGLGKTALFHAAELNHFNVLKYLLRNGANVDPVDQENYRALTIATEKGHKQVVEALSIYSKQYLDDALFLAALRGHDEIIDSLTNYGASVYERLDDGRTPLMMAAQNGHKETVRVLLENGANRFATDLEGKTASQYSSEAGFLEIAEYLGKDPEKEELMILPVNEGTVEEAVEKAVQADYEEQKLKEEIETPEINFAASEELVADTGQSSTPTGSVDAVKKAVSGASETSGTIKKAVQSSTVAPPASVSVSTMDGKKLKKAAAPQPVKERLKFETYREETLPVKVASVDAEKVSVKYLFGVHDTIEVFPGEMIPQTSLKVVKAVQKRDHTKMSQGRPADVSDVYVEDTTTGEKRVMTTGLNLNRSSNLAIIKDNLTGERLYAKKGDIFESAEGQLTEVIEVRPTQVIIQNVDTGETETIQRFQ